jgi:hypothetical protein
LPAATLDQYGLAPEETWAIIKMKLTARIAA